MAKNKKYVGVNFLGGNEIYLYLQIDVWIFLVACMHNKSQFPWAQDFFFSLHTSDLTSTSRMRWIQCSDLLSRISIVKQQIKDKVWKLCFYLNCVNICKFRYVKCRLSFEYKWSRRSLIGVVLWYGYDTNMF